MAELGDLADGAAPIRREQLMEELVVVNMPVADAIASRYRNRGIALEDLRQVAYLALVKASQRFDPQAGHAFLSFAVPTIRGEVRRHFRDRGWMVRPPRQVQDLQAEAHRAQSELAFELGRLPTSTEVAEKLGERPEVVGEALTARGCFFPASLDVPVGEAGTLGDLLSSGESTQEASDARVALAAVVRELPERDRRILGLRFYDGLTQREIAEEIGVTQMQVSRLLSRIFRDLRRSLGPVTAPTADRGEKSAS